MNKKGEFKLNMFKCGCNCGSAAFPTKCWYHHYHISNSPRNKTKQHFSCGQDFNHLNKVDLAPCWALNCRNSPHCHGDGPKPLNCGAHWVKGGDDSDGAPDWSHFVRVMGEDDGTASAFVQRPPHRGCLRRTPNLHHLWQCKGKHIRQAAVGHTDLSFLWVLCRRIINLLTYCLVKIRGAKSPRTSCQSRGSVIRLCWALHTADAKQVQALTPAPFKAKRAQIQLY